MKLYNINLTVTDEDNNEQLVSLRAPHLTGLQVKELANVTLGGILREPEPEIAITPVPKQKRRGIKRMLSKRVVPPIEPLELTAADKRDLEYR